MTEAHACEQLAQVCYLEADRPRFEPATFRIASERSTAKPHHRVVKAEGIKTIIRAHGLSWLTGEVRHHLALDTQTDCMVNYRSTEAWCVCRSEPPTAYTKQSSETTPTRLRATVMSAQRDQTFDRGSKQSTAGESCAASAELLRPPTT